MQYATALKSTRMQDVIDAIDAGSGPGYIEICSAGYVDVLATIVLAKPSFTESNGVITLANTPRTDTNPDYTGTAAVARIRDSDGNVIISDLTVGVSTGNIQLSALDIYYAGDPITLSSGSITHG